MDWSNWREANRTDPDKDLEKFKSASSLEVAEAELLLLEVQIDEAKSAETYEKEEVDSSIVHTREDTVLMVSHLTGIHIASNRIVSKLNILVAIGVLLLGAHILGLAFLSNFL